MARQTVPRQTETQSHQTPVMSDEAFANLGTEEVAYLRPVRMPEGVAVGIFSASGLQVGVAPEANAALALIYENELTPVSLH